MLKKLIVAGVVMLGCNLLLSTLESCVPQSYEERCTPPTCFNTDSLALKIFDDGWGQMISSSHTSGKATNLRFEVTVIGDRAVCYKPTPKPNRFSFFTTAYAYSPPDCNIFMSSDSIIGYNIYSNAVYDNLHPVGMSLNDIVIAEGFPVRAYNNNGKTETNLLTFRINSDPADTGRHVFTICLAQADGDTVRVTSPEIKLLLQ